MAQAKHINGYTFEDSFFKTKYGDIFYSSIGNTKKPKVLLVYGSPGVTYHWHTFIRTSDILKNHQVIVFDRVGYGKTTIKRPLSLRQQSQVLKSFLLQECIPCYVIGHSYGGALALQLAVDYPNHVAGVASISGTIAAPYQNPRWYNYVSKYSLVYFLLPQFFKNSNVEMFALKKNLKTLEKRLPKLKMNVALVQGGKDFLVDPRSPYYIRKHLTNANVKIFFRKKANHFLIQNAVPLIMESLDWLIEQRRVK